MTFQCRVGRRHTRLLGVGVRSRGASTPLVWRFVLEFIPVLVRLVLATPHAHIAADAHTASLLGHHTAQSGALGQARELLRREDDERGGLDLETVRNEGIDAAPQVDARGRAIVRVHVLGVLQFLIQSEAEAIFPFVANGQVRENKVPSWSWAVEVGHAGDRCAGQNREARGRGRTTTARGNGASILEGGKEEEVGVVCEGDLLLAFEDAQLDNRRRVHGTSVGARLCTTPTGAGAFGLLDDLQRISDLASVLGGAHGGALRLIGNGNNGCHWYYSGLQAVSMVLW